MVTIPANGWTPEAEATVRNMADALVGLCDGLDDADSVCRMVKAMVREGAVDIAWTDELLTGSKFTSSFVLGAEMGAGPHEVLGLVAALTRLGYDPGESATCVRHLIAQLNRVFLVPASGWDAVKEKIIPRWLRRWIRVRKRVNPETVSFVRGGGITGLTDYLWRMRREHDDKSLLLLIPSIRAFHAFMAITDENNRAEIRDVVAAVWKVK